MQLTDAGAAFPIAACPGHRCLSSFLSLVEQAHSDITIGRLVRLAEFYDIGPAYLFDGAPTAPADQASVPSFIVRPGHGAPWRTGIAEAVSRARDSAG